MGFFAGELEFVLRSHMAHPQGSPWSILTRIGVHPQQIDRLKKASEDIAQVATLPENYMVKIKTELELTPNEWSRLQASMEADVFLRMLLYHAYPLEVAANTANTIFAAMLKDRLTIGGSNESTYAPLSAEDAKQMPKPSRIRRGRGIRRRAYDE